METNIIGSFVALGGVPLIIGIVQIFKEFIEDKRYYPFIAVGIGLAVNAIAGWVLGASAPVEWVTYLFNGVIAGLAASGLYSTSSTIRNN